MIDPIIQDPQLIELARKKLRAEIDEINRPLWRKPAFYGIIGPTLLAAGTLWVAINSDAFDNAQTLLELRTTQAEAEEARLNELKSTLASEEARVALAQEHLKDREAKIEEELAAIEAKFILDQNELEANFRAESERAAADLARLQTQLTLQTDEMEALKMQSAGELQKMTDELTALSGKIVLKEAELARVTQEIELAEVRTLLETMSLQTMYVQANAFKTLQQLARDEDATRAYLKDYVEGEITAKMKVAVLILLDRVEQTSSSKQRVLGFVDDHVEDPGVWEELSGNAFSDHDAAIGIFLKHAAGDRMPREGYFNFLLRFSWWHRDYEEDHIPAIRTPDGFRALERGWKEISEHGQAWEVKKAFTITSALHTEVAMVVAAESFPRWGRFEDDIMSEVLLVMTEEGRLNKTDQAYLEFRDALRNGFDDDWLATPKRQAILSAIKAGNAAQALAAAESF